MTPYEDNPRNKLRMTPQRRAILEELRARPTHPTADEVYQMVRKRMPRVSLGTVYRNLELLAEAGYVKKLELAGHRRRYDARLEEHYHFRCKRCGKVFDFPLELQDVLCKYAAQNQDFQVDDCRVEFTGLCPECRKLEQNKG